MNAIKRLSWAFAAVASLSLRFSALAEDIPNTVARPKIALALGGGGTRGAAHVGVLRVLAREHIPIDFIAGTSMGAIVGGLYAAGVPLERIEKDLLDRKMLKAYVTVPIAVRVAVIPIFFVPHMFGYRPYDGLYRGEKFRNFLDKQVPESHRNMENLQIPFCAVAANLLNGRAVSIDKGNLGKALQASSAIPFLRRPVPYGDQELFVDGGIENNLPVKQARDMGGDIVIAVRVDEDVHVQEQSEKFRHILTIPHRVVSMLLSRLDDLEAKNADIVISPNVDHIHLLSEKRADAVRAIRSGELAAEAALPSIRAKLGETALAKNSQLKSDSSKTD